MKKRFVIMTLMLSLLMVAASVSTAFATLSDDDAYGYTIKVYAGEQGHFEDPSVGTVSDGGKTLTIKTDAGESLTINEETTGFVLDNKDYYLRGFRKAGHDNDELIATFPSVDSDASYEAAYGLKGGMVKYTVRYVDKYGNELHSEETFYGMEGDKPVVSFRYADGYQPQAYNLKKTLSSNESENVFEFTYKRIAGTSDQDDDDDEDNDAGTANAANNGNAATGTQAGNADATAEADDQPADIMDLDDNETPLAGGDDVDGSDKSDESEGLSVAAKIGIGAAIVAAIAAAAALIIRRRNSEYDDDDYEDEAEESKE